MDLTRIWKLVLNGLASYFSIYEPAKFKKAIKTEKFREILTFFVVSIFFAVLGAILLGAGGEILPKNLGQDFLPIPMLVGLSGILIAITLLNLWQPLWLSSYISILSIVTATFIDTTPLLLKTPLYLIVAFLVFPTIYYSMKPKLPKTFIVIGFLAFILLIIGMYSIDKIYGMPALDLYLNNGSNPSQRLPYNITCESVGGKVLADYNLNCIFSPDLHNISGSIEFALKNGSTINHTFNGTFTPTEDIERLNFYFSGTNSKSEVLCFSTAITIDFVSEEEYKSNKEKFVTYFLGLLYISLLGVPLSVLEIKKKFTEGR